MAELPVEELKVYLLLKKTKQDSAGIAPLYARITPPGQKLFEVYTKINIPVSYWDQEEQQLLNKARQPVLAKEIRNIQDRIEEVHHDLSAAGGHYLPDQFRLMLFGESKKLNHYTYRSIYDKHFSLESDDIAEGTWKNYRSTHRFFQEFMQKEMRVNDLLLTAFSRQLMIEFMAWLKKRKPGKGQRPCTQITAQKHTERLVRLLNFAVEMQYIPFNPVVNLKKKKFVKDRTYLEHDELQVLQEAQLGKQNLTEARDCFLFSCYTGLSFSDIKSLNKNDLVKDLHGNLSIAKVRQKTSRTREVKFFVPLLPPALEILRKYSDHAECEYKNVLLPVRCNQPYNRLLKAIAMKCGISKDLSSHAARHTFATTVTQDNGVSLEAISKMLGHTQIKTTQIYSRTTLRKVTSEMDRLKNIYSAQTQQKSDTGT